MIRSEKTHLLVKAITHAGMTGKNNEDRYAVSAYQLGDPQNTPVILAILSDGIGGHRAGEVASEMVVNSISNYVAKSDAGDPSKTLEEAIQLASQEVYTMSQADSGHKGMGATVSCAWVIGNRLYTATVGDSRIYLMRGGQIWQISTDHSWIQEAIEAGILTPEQAVGHPNAHIIRRYVGSPTPPEVDFRIRLGDALSNEQMKARQGMELMDGDRVLLCSDGLSDLVKDTEVLEITNQNPLEPALQKLVDLANQRGGHDNITIIGIQVPNGTAVQKPVFPWRTATLGCLGVLALAAVITLAVFGYLNRKQIMDFLRPPSVTPAVTLEGTLLPMVSGTVSPQVETTKAASTQTTTMRPTRTSTAPSNILPPPNGQTMSPQPTTTAVTATPTVTATGSTTP